ncbi:MAG TPA: hypothetical protein VF944_02730 [Candidatus Bathyarchaeia archaeon]
MTSTPFSEVWFRIRGHSGETFVTKTGLEFAYEVKDDAFFPSRTDYRISKTDFEKAYRLVPLEGPGVIASLVRGSAYVWAVLHDRRISAGRW